MVCRIALAYNDYFYDNDNYYDNYNYNYYYYDNNNYNNYYDIYYDYSDDDTATYVMIASVRHSGVDFHQSLHIVLL
jgi:outer membrane receptor protein involved in Fe transport